MGEPFWIAEVGFFWRLDALPIAQPTVPKHWRHIRSFCVPVKNIGFALNYFRCCFYCCMGWTFKEWNGWPKYGKHCCAMCLHASCSVSSYRVLNTDNMSILGLTIDYGPYGFMDQYDPSHVCNASGQSSVSLSQLAQAVWKILKLRINNVSHSKFAKLH